MFALIYISFDRGSIEDCTVESTILSIKSFQFTISFDSPAHIEIRCIIETHSDLLVVELQFEILRLNNKLIEGSI